MTAKNRKVIQSYFVGWFVASVIWELLWNTDRVPLNPYLATFHTRVTVFVSAWLIQAIGFSALHLLIDHYIKGKVLFVKLIAFTLTLQFITGVVLLTCLFFLFRHFDIILANVSLFQFYSQPVIHVAFIYALLTNFSIVLFIYINLMLGNGNLWKMITGKFYTPTVEERIFMFLDLRGSTTIAEKLGHVKYSRLIQDCFYDLAVVHHYKAEIYQYVGDEAVLVWNVKDGLQRHNCLLALYAFQDVLNSRIDHYKMNYGTVPVFKAGMNMGKITITEVGEFKREIAYHGDTINTAARIQGECNRLESDLLVSGYLLHKLQTIASLKAESKGEIPLKGKLRSVTIHAIDGRSKQVSLETARA